MAGSGTTISSFLLGGACVLLTVPILWMLYNVYFHPLRKYPGPTSWAATRLPWIRASTAGRLHREVLRLHKQYGGIVRIGPNELSYTTENAWKQIYGHRQVEMPKDLRGAGLLPTFKGTDSIVTAPRQDHSRMRRTVSHAFSDNALREQEHIIQQYVDLFINKLRQRAPEGPQDLVKWYNWTTFDIMGDLSFGEPFGCLEAGRYHEWVSMIFNGVKVYPWMQAAVYYGLAFLREYVTPTRLVNAKKEADARAYAKLDRRLEKKDLDRKDFMSYILRHNGQGTPSMEKPEIQETAVVLIIAGSETTATFLSGFTYCLLRSPRVYARLVKEVRDKFDRYEDITILKAQQLQYLPAVVEEAFRAYPPSPNNFPRIVPGAGEAIEGRWVAGDTTVGINQWATNHDTANFYRPDDFLPERWLRPELHEKGDVSPEYFSKDKKGGVQAFSFGPRNCLGKSMAYAELRVIICKLLFSFDLKLAPESDNASWIQDQETYVLWEKPKLMVELTPRDA